MIAIHVLPYRVWNWGFLQGGCVRDLALHFEEAFRQLGVRLGHELAEMIVSGEVPRRRPAPTLSLRRSTDGSPRAPKILPGLTGRRRRPGEEPPRCGRAGCDRLSRTRGYCQTHYVQWLKAGGARSFG